VENGTDFLMMTPQARRRAGNRSWRQLTAHLPGGGMLPAMSVEGEAVSPEVLATVLAETFGDSYGGVINAAMRQDLTRRIERTIREALVAERKHVAALCLRRQALWEEAEGRPNTPDPLRAEARSRANEAAYLADAIEAR
jgi:hypothetical protein